MTHPSKLKIEAAIRVLKEPHEVFEAIADPVKMSGYFISYGSERMAAGKVITWRFPEFETGFPIRVGEVEADRYLSWYWEVETKEHLVEITLASSGDGATLVTVTEKERDPDEAGINWLKQNTYGWANFLACLKAWLEYGINLRKGAFDHLRQ